MKQNIILFTDSFPYATKETFLNTEIYILSRYYHQIFIIPLRNTDKKRAVPKNVKVIDKFAKTREKKIFRIIKTLFSKAFYWPIFLDFPKSLSLNYLKLNFIWSYNAVKMKKIVVNLIKKENFNFDNTIFYTYAFTSNSIALTFLKKEHYHDMKIITRAHGGDLYEDINNINVFPFRRFVLKHIDKVYAISQDGVGHLIQMYPEYIDKFKLSRLGVVSYGKTKKKTNNNVIHIVSCSNIIPLKRVYLIAEIINNMKNHNVIWTHFGKGKDTKLNRILEKISKRITVCFMGQQPNENVYKYYIDNSIDIFLNVSISEGIPVSIMEAMSAGIPVIATDVGGVSEIVKNGYNGFLLKKDFKIKDATQKIFEIVENKEKFNANAYNTWRINFNAENNYREFCKSI